MKSLILVALLGLLSLTSAAQMSYYFTASKYIKSNSLYTVELNIHRQLPEPLEVHVSVMLNNSYRRSPKDVNYMPETIMAEKTVTFEEQGTQTAELNIPTLQQEGIQFWALEAYLEVNCTGAFSAYHSERLQMQRNSLDVYVQSDKGMYKGGDLVRFRTFATDSELKPYLGTFNITIMDPDSNKLKIFRNVKSDSGVISKTFQLSDQPPLGTWSIIISTEMTEEKRHNFKVSEYVLPKFEVNVEMPPFIVHVSDVFRAIVEAKYTFGKPVKGNASIMIGPRADGYTCREAWQKNRYSSRDVPVCRRHKILTELDKDGKYDIELKVADMVNLLPFTVCNYRGNPCNLTREHLRYKTILVWVNVTETATGVMLPGDGSISFSGSPTDVKFLAATPNNYKPGLPFIGYIQLSQPDGSPIPESDLKKADGEYRKVNLTITYKCPNNWNRYPYYPEPPRLPPAPPGPAPTPAGNSSKMGTTSTTTETTTTMTTTTTEPPCVEMSESRPLEISPAGVIAFEVEPVEEKYQNVILGAKFMPKEGIESRATRYIQPFETESKKGIRVITEMVDGALKPGSTAVFQVTASEKIPRIRYDIIAKGDLAYSAEKVYDTPAMTQNFSLTITDDFARKIAPTPRIVVWYVRKDGEIIADSVSFSVESELANQVNVAFSTNETKPGKDMNLMVEAYKGSAVGLLVVDQSVKLLASGNDITKEMVEDNLRQYNPNTPYYPMLYMRGGWGGFCCGCWPYQISGSDTKDLFQQAGYILFTDGLIYEKPIVYNPMLRGERGERGPGIMFESASSGTADAATAGRAAGGPVLSTSKGPQVANDLKPVEKVRTEFPETWIWLDTILGPEGKLVHRTQAPDTITSWVASGFALSKDKGLGVSSQAKMTVFKPFFVSLTLPFALIRGEQFGLKATVFNYLPKEQNVTVTLEKSRYFEVLLNGKEVSRTAQQTVTVPANDVQTVVYWIIPNKVGHMNITVRAQSSQAADALRRIIPVRPEGTPQQHTESMLISKSQQSAPFVKVLKANFPPKDVVPDSQRVQVTVIGDIMGPMMNNLNNFVKMPYGCGEQNMVNFVPNIQILRYLDAAKLDMPELREKAISYMETGYQREITYKRDDGSFSAFGNRDAYGSTWLTAFVLKSFAQAVPYMDVNENHIKGAVQFLTRMQAPDGSFKQPGKTASYLAGGSGTHANMAAYVAIALAMARDANYTDPEFKKEIKKLVDTPLQDTVKFLESNMTGIETDPYSMAICTYAFTIIGTMQADAALDKLNTMAFDQNGMKYWANQKEEEEDYTKPWWYYRRTRTYDVEMTSYSMLTNLFYGSPDKSLPTVRWLTKKRNPYGGYYSTQDTVMALQALTEFATLALKQSGKQKMYVRVSADIQDLEFDPITPENSMILQVREIPQSIKSLTVMGTGSGAAMVQMVLNYNIMDPDYSQDLQVKVDSMEDQINKKVMVDVCFKWLKKGEDSGMGILEITPLSGHDIDTETLQKDYPAIKRHEKNGQTLVTYWDKFEESDTCLNITLIKTVDVANIQEAEVKIYSYYKPEMSQTILYLPKNMKSIDPCDACPACCTLGAIEGEGIIIEQNNKDTDNQNNVNRNNNRPSKPKKPRSGNSKDSATFAVPSVIITAVLAIFAMLR